MPSNNEKLAKGVPFLKSFGLVVKKVGGLDKPKLNAGLIEKKTGH